MKKVNFKNITAVNRLYEATLKPRHTPLARIFYFIWIPVGSVFLLYTGFAEPWHKQLFGYLLAQGVSSFVVLYILTPLIFAIRAIIVVEIISYLYHRFFQHLGMLTRRAALIRRNQKFHWIHHMIFYPIGRLYRRKAKYTVAEPGFPISWAIPTLGGMGLFIFINGFNLSTVVFLVTVYLYVKLIDLIHHRFHQTDHSWVHNPYFNMLENIHILHHWDQGANYTITNPVMDMLFGTYLSPARNKREIGESLDDHELTRSDIINWRYLLVNATPAEYAAFISAARKYPGGLRKVDRLLALLKIRYSSKHDAQAADLYERARQCLAKINTVHSKGILRRFSPLPFKKK